MGAVFVLFIKQFWFVFVVFITFMSMKRQIVIFLLIFFSGFLQESQAQYDPILKEGATWLVGRNIVDGTIFPSYYILCGDTTLNGSDYKIYNLLGFLNDLKPKYFLREDGAKLFLFDTEIEEEVLLQDLDAQLGSQWPGDFVFILDTIFFKEYNNVSRKVLSYQKENFSNF